MCCLTQAVLALSGSEPLTPIGPDSAPPRGALGYLTGASPRGPETFAPPPPHHCPSSDAWGLFSGPADGGRGHRSGEARPPSRGNCGVLGGCLRSAASQGLLWMAEICDLLESPEPIAAPSITTCRGEGGDCWGGGGPSARGSDSGASLSACSSQELTCCAGWRQQGDECGIGEWVTLGSGPVRGRGCTERRRQVRRLDWGHLGPSCPQLCAKATPRARRTRCACDLASAAAATATSGPTATPVRAERGGQGPRGAGPGREAER